MPLGYETSSIVIPHGATKYTQRSPADGPSLRRRFAQHLDAVSPQMRDRSVWVGNVEADMVAADVAVLWDIFLLAIDFIFEQFDRRTVGAF